MISDNIERVANLEQEILTANHKHIDDMVRVPRYERHWGTKINLQKQHPSFWF